ncbi:MAG: hemerythrin family protein [Nitrospinae bacterium]|nr:hemerythrin family protein [Nitrospinota bacterium]
MLIWGQEYSVNNIILDDQHKKLFMILNKIASVIQQGTSHIFYPLVIELESYTIFHFSMEENEMEEAGFPGLADHCKEHQKFKAELAKFKEKAFDLDAKALMEMHEYLNDWIKNHILVQDKKYVPYITKAKNEDDY